VLYSDACRELNVEPYSSDQEIKSAYRKLVRRYHPDVNDGDPKAVEKFQKIQEAYDVVSSADHISRAGLGPTRRTSAAAPKTSGSWPGDRVPLRSQMIGGDVTGNLKVTLREVFSGTTADITFDDLSGCERCGATGGEPGTIWIPCPPCQGMASSHCEWCAGEGQVPAEACSSCNGAGVDDLQRTVRVVVPRSAKDKQTLRVRAKGRWGVKGRGDIRLDLQVEPHPHLKRSGDDLYVELPVGVLQAVLGGEALVDGLESEPYRIAITPGSSSGKRFRLAGKGMYKGSDGDDRGDLYAQISVQVPNNLSPRQHRLWEMLLEAELDPGESVEGSDLAVDLPE